MVISVILVTHTEQLARLLRVLNKERVYHVLS